ncbi:MAG: LysE family translocator [Pseudomonadota bacterium]
MLDVLLSFDPALLVAFVLAGLLLNITPGADFVFISASSIAGGPKVGICAALGVNLGILVHVCAAAAGLSAVLIANPAAYDLVRYAGAAYLLYIAWQSWNAIGVLADGQSAQSIKRAIGRGFVTNVLNPKTALFIFAFIPQFTNPSIGPIWMQILILGAIFLVNGFVFAMTLAVVTGTFADALRTRVRILNKITAILFGGLAARLIID